jgi:hypothetical protein
VPNESTSITQPLFVNHCLLFAPIRSVFGLKERVRGTCSVVYKKNTKQGDGQKGGRWDEYEYTSVFLGFIYYLFLDTYQPIEIPTVLDSCSPHRFPHALPRFARRGPDRSISITSLHHSKHGPCSLFFYRAVSSRSYPLCGVHNNTPLTVVTHNLCSPFDSLSNPQMTSVIM